jgi:hypothetical protein
MARPSNRTLRKYRKPLEFDPSPLYAVERQADGTFSHWMAFDPKYGPASQAQIDWHIEHGTPGAEDWEVGVPLGAEHKVHERKQ